jgi:apolipoprotein N-acyltransferase
MGVARARTLPLENGPRVVVVGTHVTPELRGTPGAAALAAMAQVEVALRRIDPGTVDLVVLPEATVSTPLEEKEALWARGVLTALVSELNAPVIVGALGRVGLEAAEGALTNSAFLLSPGDSLIQRYDKARLVPGMEAGLYQRGSGRATFRAGDWIVAPLLCYESLFGGAARKGRKAGAQLLLNLSSDIWFGQETTLLGSLFLHQHPAHLVLRAVENRMSVARAANGGLSFVLDPTGRVISDTVSPKGGVTSARVPTFEGMTLFSRTGDWIGPGSALLCLFLLLADPRRIRTMVFRGPRVDS